MIMINLISTVIEILYASWRKILISCASQGERSCFDIKQQLQSCSRSGTFQVDICLYWTQTCSVQLKDSHHMTLKIYFRNKFVLYPWSCFLCSFNKGNWELCITASDSGTACSYLVFQTSAGSTVYSYRIKRISICSHVKLFVL